MFNSFFYHGVVRKTIITFGSMFSNIRIQRRDGEGQLTQNIRVPISYAQKEKFVIRRQEDQTLDPVMAIDLPRLSFEISSYNYDPSRKVNSTHKLIKQTGQTKQQFAPVPYNLGIKLHAYTKTQEDALIILEQILPLFAPEYNVTVAAVPEMEIYQDIPIQLNSVEVGTVYSEDRNEQKMVIHSLDFTAKVNLFGPIQPVGVIKLADVDIDDFANFQAEVIPRDAGKDDPHEIVERVT